MASRFRSSFMVRVRAGQDQDPTIMASDRPDRTDRCHNRLSRAFPAGFEEEVAALRRRPVVDVDAACARAMVAGASPVDIPVPEQHWNGAPLDVTMTGDRPEPMRMAFLLGPSGELIDLYEG